MTNNVLSGRKNICNFVGRSWDTVKGWIQEKKFPAVKLDGVWESYPDMIDKWRRDIIENKRGQDV
jgi:hypothetical protein